jgi:hypothetical protein
MSRDNIISVNGLSTSIIDVRVIPGRRKEINSDSKTSRAIRATGIATKDGEIFLAVSIYKGCRVDTGYRLIYTFDIHNSLIVDSLNAGMFIDSMPTGAKLVASYVSEDFVRLGAWPADSMEGIQCSAQL